MGDGYNYHCEDCGKPMAVVDVESGDVPSLKCPECGGDFKASHCLGWD